MSKLTPEEETALKIEQVILSLKSDDPKTFIGSSNDCALCKKYKPDNESGYPGSWCKKCPVYITEGFRGCLMNDFREIDHLIFSDSPVEALSGLLAIMVYLHGFNHV